MLDSTMFIGGARNVKRFTRDVDLLEFQRELDALIRVHDGDDLIWPAARLFERASPWPYAVAELERALDAVLNRIGGAMDERPTIRQIVRPWAWPSE